MPVSRRRPWLIFYDIALESPLVVKLDRNEYRIGTSASCDIILPWDADMFAPSDGSVTLRRKPPSELLGECWELVPVAGTIPRLNGEESQDPFVCRGGARCMPLVGVPPGPLVLYDGDFLELYFSSMYEGGQVYRCHFASTKQCPITDGTETPCPNWLNLEDKLWKKIFSHVPPSEALSNIAGVCTRFRKLVKEGIPYEHITLGFTKGPNYSVPCLRDLQWLADTSSGQVKTLNFRKSDSCSSDLKPYEYHETDRWIYYSNYWMRIFNCDWPNLVSLTLVDTAIHNLDTLLPALVEEGNRLLNLKSLKIVCNEDFSWSRFEDVPFASLEELAIMPANNTGVHFDGQQFFRHQFPNLKHMACSLPLQHLGLFSGILIDEPTKLESLMLSSFRPMDVLFEDSEDGPWEHAFFQAVGAGKFDCLTSLLLELSDWQHTAIQSVRFRAVKELCFVADDFMADEPISVEQLSDCFPQLQSLVLGQGIPLDWANSSNDEFLGRLVCLGVSVDSHVMRRIPWSELPALEFLSIYGEHANPAKIFSHVKAGADKLKWLQIGAFDYEWAVNDILNESTVSDGADTADEVSINDLAEMVSTSNIEYFEFTPPESEDFSVREMKYFLRLLLGNSSGSLTVVVINDFELVSSSDDQDSAFHSTEVVDSISSYYSSNDDEKNESCENTGKYLCTSPAGLKLAKTVRAVAQEQLQLVRYGDATLYCPSNVKSCERHVGFPPGHFVKFLKFAQGRRASDLL